MLAPHITPVLPRGPERSGPRLSSGVPGRGHRSEVPFSRGLLVSRGMRLSGGSQLWTVDGTGREHEPQCSVVIPLREDAYRCPDAWACCSSHPMVAGLSPSWGP